MSYLRDWPRDCRLVGVNFNMAIRVCEDLARLRYRFQMVANEQVLHYRYESLHNWGRDSELSREIIRNASNFRVDIDNYYNLPAL